MARRPKSSARIAQRSQIKISGQPAPTPSNPVQPRLLDWMDYCAGAMIAAVTGGLYAVTAARDIVVGDTPELVTAAAILGVPHPPGYPLFTMLGHLFSLLSVGPLPFRVNLLAVVCGTGAVAIVYFTALKLTANRITSAVAALVLAFTPLFWSWSLVAEVFSLNNLLAAGLIYLLVIWYSQPDRMEFLVAGAFVSGLGLANQQTIVLVGPAVLFLLFLRRKELFARPRMVAASLAALLLGLVPYAYLPWAAARHPSWNWGDPSSLQNFLAVITRQHFGSGQLMNVPEFQGGSSIDRIFSLGASFGVLAGLLVVLGAIQAYRRRRWYFWLSMLAFAFAGPAFVAYSNVNLTVPMLQYVLERFYLLSHVVLAPLIAFGILLLSELAGLAVPRLGTNAIAVVSTVVLMLALAGAIAHYPKIDQSKNHVLRTFAEDILATSEPGSVLVVSGDVAVMPLIYLTDVEHYRRDISLIVMPLMRSDWYLAHLREQYPNLVIPFSHYDGRSGTMKALIEANPGRKFAMDGVESEQSLNEGYWFHRRGLLDVIEPMSRDVKIDELIAETEDLYRKYRPPSPEQIKWQSLEPMILSHYATPAYVVAQECERVHHYPQARAWYQRALSIDPSLSNVREALERLPQAQ